MTETRTITYTCACGHQFNVKVKDFEDKGTLVKTFIVGPHQCPKCQRPVKI